MGFTFCQKFKGLSLSSHVNQRVVLVRTCQRQIFAAINVEAFYIRQNTVLSYCFLHSWDTHTKTFQFVCWITLGINTTSWILRIFCDSIFWMIEFSYFVVQFEGISFVLRGVFSYWIHLRTKEYQCCSVLLKDFRFQQNNPKYTQKWGYMSLWNNDNTSNSHYMSEN